ncbi:O-methyltransferase [Rhodocytophaga rosea]|uniref:O-methyltransferase n=1 Tax=Rhodocytophaga rosea TaxID=2704465 RepID=A0A6C0GGU4_9BACT|nr:O-methyltransferase [Rhodocytophaga rosea]QHT67044.1 O-methyltransferase [Rhodocytophaga rosea]
MEFLSAALNQYVEEHTSSEPPVLQELNRDTHAHVLKPRMLSGHLQGRLLSLFSHMMRPMNVLEIGTYTGYSALCLAEGLQEGGKVYTIDINEELESRVRQYFAKAGATHQIEYRIGNALDIIPSLDIMFDMVFIDADKINYQRYYDMVLNKIRPGGIIIADNVLWSGKVVADTIKKGDAETYAILAFNAAVQQDERVENILLPVRDGLMIVRKK